MLVRSARLINKVDLTYHFDLLSCREIELKVYSRFVIRAFE